MEKNRKERTLPQMSEAELEKEKTIAVKVASKYAAGIIIVDGDNRQFRIAISSKVGTGCTQGP